MALCRICISEITYHLLEKVTLVSAIVPPVETWNSDTCKLSLYLCMRVCACVGLYLHVADICSVHTCIAMLITMHESGCD